MLYVYSFNTSLHPFILYFLPSLSVRPASFIEEGLDDRFVLYSTVHPRSRSDLNSELGVQEIGTCPAHALFLVTHIGVSFNILCHKIFLVSQVNLFCLWHHWFYGIFFTSGPHQQAGFFFSGKSNSPCTLLWVICSVSSALYSGVPSLNSHKDTSFKYRRFWFRTHHLKHFCRYRIIMLTNFHERSMPCVSSSHQNDTLPIVRTNAHVRSARDP